MAIGSKATLVAKKAPRPAAPAAKAVPTKAAPAAKKGFPPRKAGAKAAPARPAYPRFDAPSDFKPFFLDVTFNSGADGMIIPNEIKALRIKGKWETAENPRYDLAEYDVATLVGIASRLSSITYAANLLKRLPLDSRFKLIIRVSKRAADGSILVGVKAGAMSAPGSAKMKWIKDNTNPVYRKLRRCNRLMPSAFVDVQLPPMKRRGKKAEEDGDE